MKKETSSPITIKRCYEHLGGKLGDILFQRMLRLKWFKPLKGERTTYIITKRGRKELAKLGVDIACFSKKEQKKIYSMAEKSRKFPKNPQNPPKPPKKSVVNK